MMAARPNIGSDTIDDDELRARAMGFHFQPGMTEAQGDAIAERLDRIVNLLESIDLSLGRVLIRDATRAP